MTKLKRVLIMAGGTGGHVFPGLAAAHFFRGRGVDVHWLGTSQGLEAKVIPAEKIPLHFITISGLRGKGIKALLTAPLRIIQAVLEARKIIAELKPDVVIGMGGFASGPGGVASWLAGCPLVIHEQNAKAGLTNKILANFAKRVLQGFPGAFKQSQKVITIGNPVRFEIENIPAPETRLAADRKPFRLLVLGGSLGAKALNELVPRTLAKLSSDIRPEVWHQTGEKHFEDTKSLYESTGIRANLVPFVKDMAEVYSWADMVLCRAGALTVAELCAAGLGAVFVPFPHAVDDHQTANADFMVKQNAALCVQQKDLTEDRLADIVEQFALSPFKRIEMAQAAFRLRQIHVTEKIYDICEEISR
ncbi:MAG TPA: undecaprenyldiphospho-muramoylpentapeptide beta-N-acetylglucosaminyltransferase [Gammaproteobacteria bacterium]|nr:undecaprenyldiphospho-muramoylpentapeptide beta-N-acetylglucosaminyltransferase [Gammaproteobacteria bacterium]